MQVEAKFARVQVWGSKGPATDLVRKLRGLRIGRAIGRRRSRAREISKVSVKNRGGRHAGPGCAVSCEAVWLGPRDRVERETGKREQGERVQDNGWEGGSDSDVKSSDPLRASDHTRQGLL